MLRHGSAAHLTRCVFQSPKLRKRWWNKRISHDLISYKDWKLQPYNNYLWVWLKQWYSRLHLPAQLHPQLNPWRKDGSLSWLTAWPVWHHPSSIHQLSCELPLGIFGKSTSNVARLKKIEAILGEAYMQRWFSKEAVGIIIEVYSPWKTCCSLRPVSPESKIPRWLWVH